MSVVVLALMKHFLSSLDALLYLSDYSKFGDEVSKLTICSFCIESSKQK